MQAAQAVLVFFGSFVALAVFLSLFRSNPDASRDELIRRTRRDQYRD